jgi:photosystem II stability/assembly factor-like uncharacterized protein
MKNLFAFLVCCALLSALSFADEHAANAAKSDTLYSPRGIGGGGALASYSISPYSPLRFVGTDMGTLFRSLDGGKSWIPINQAQASFGSDLSLSTELGFSSDGKSVFYSDSGHDPKRSRDQGASFTAMKMDLNDQERIRYFVGDPKDAKLILCGTTEGLWISRNLGDSWSKVPGVSGSSAGTVFLDHGNHSQIFHASNSYVYESADEGKKFETFYTSPQSKIRNFTGGRDVHGTTLVLIDTNGEEACSWLKRASDASEEQKRNNIKECGFVWINHFDDEKNPGNFLQTKKDGGRFVRMAQNDSQTLYLTGGDWVRQYGSKIWISTDAGVKWNLAFQVYDWDQRPYAPWSKNKLEYSAVGLDVGWDDNAPYSFSVDPKNSSIAGGTGLYFLHTTEDKGEHWKAPFTQFADSGERLKGKRWKSTGLEVTSILRLKFHPKNTKIAYAAAADIGGLVTEDGGESFRISKAKYNTNYDYAFDPAKPDWVYAASGARHDFPLNLNTPIHGEGGIFVSQNRGKSWKRLTETNASFNRQFLSVAFDPIRHTLYAGSQGGGIARSSDSGKHWEWFNPGLPKGDLVIPQIEVSPKDGTAYALLTGNAPEFQNSAVTGIYRLTAGTWRLLRDTVVRPKEVDSKYPLWQFPSSFAVDFSKKEPVLWLTDIENKGAWLATGAWRSTNGGQTWTRQVQSTHPTQVTLNEKAPNEVIVSGLYDVTGKWGKGGALISRDSGASFLKNEKLPLQANLDGYTSDPAHKGQGFFQFFGGGMLYGPTFATEK